MKSNAIILLLFFNAINSYAQSIEKTEKIKSYRIWVKGEVKIEGILYSSSDSSVSIIPYTKEWTESNKNSITEISIEKISKIKLRRLNRVGNGALWGLGIAGAGGLGLGIAAGLYGGQVLYGAFIGSVIFGGVGAGIGALIGSNKKSYNIQYSLHEFQNVYKNEFDSKSLKGQGFEF